MKESKLKHKACSLCGVVHEVNELTELDGKFLCPECIIRETAVCYRCGDRINYANSFKYYRNIAMRKYLFPSIAVIVLLFYIAKIARKIFLRVRGTKV